MPQTLKFSQKKCSEGIDNHAGVCYNSIRCHALRQPVRKATKDDADVAQSVERILGKDEVTSSNLVISSIAP